VLAVNRNCQLREAVRPRPAVVAERQGRCLAAAAQTMTWATLSSSLTRYPV
jgi:hypothetical protein